jgi:hypothetical protein
MENKYKIIVYIPNSRPVTFITDSYKLEKGLIKFVDKLGKVKLFDPRLCEIEEFSK